MSSISAGTTSTTTLVHSGDTTGSLVFKTNDTGSGGTTAMTIDTSQNVTCVGNITLNNGAADGAQLTLASSGYSNWNIDNYSGNLRAYYNATEYMRMDSSGNLLVGSTSSSSGSRFKVQSGGNTSATLNLYLINSSSNELLYLRDDGGLNTGTVASGSPYNNTTGNAANANLGADGFLRRSTSSLKYKKNVQDATHGLSDLLKLRSVTYEGKAETDGQTIFGGLIAEEVDAAGLKEFVQYAEDGSPDALAYGNMVALCVKAIQELKAINDQQAETINALTARVVNLESK